MVDVVETRPRARARKKPPKGPAAQIAPVKQAESAVKSISLALQGGGAHGAFTWGVLDKLLEDGRVGIEGVSGTSAGAMNGVVLADGFLKGGRDGARAALERFWKAVASAASMAPVQPTVFDKMRREWNMDRSPPYVMFDLLTRLLSPYEFNPFNFNPLRDLLEATIDFEALRKNDQIHLFATATNVRSGKVKVFETHEMSADVLLASACLPLMFQAVEIDGEAYWDGGYMGNPALFPLIYHCSTQDVVIVQVNPLSRSEVPMTARDILNRINEISFNSTLMREMRAIATVSKFLDEGLLDPHRYKDIRVHIIESEGEMRRLGASSKLNAQWEFLQYLKDVGRRCAQRWLAEQFPAVGERSSVDIFERFL